MKRWVLIVANAFLLLGLSLAQAPRCWAADEDWTMEELVGPTQPQAVMTKDKKIVYVNKRLLRAKDKRIIELVKADPERYQFLNSEDELMLASKPNGLETGAYDDPSKKLGEFFIGVRGKP